MASTVISAPAGVPFIDMAREVAAPPEVVFRAYTEPDLLVQWLGPHGYEMTIERWDPFDGGPWRYTHVDPQGNRFGFHGVFHGPQTVDGMLQTFEFDGAPGHVSLDSLRFERTAGGTTIRNHSVFQSVADRDAMVAAGMERGVNEGFERLDDLLVRIAAQGAGTGAGR